MLLNSIFRFVFGPRIKRTEMPKASPGEGNEKAATGPLSGLGNGLIEVQYHAGYCGVGGQLGDIERSVWA